jgi:hypothetical protein
MTNVVACLRRPYVALRVSGRSLRRHMKRHRWAGVMVAAGVQTLGDTIGDTVHTKEASPISHLCADSLHYMAVYLVMIMA